MSLSQRVFIDAFRDMQRAMVALEQPFYNAARRSLLGSPAALLKNSTTAGDLFHCPATDMIENTDSYEVNAELPGYDKNNIKIELADNRTLILSGSVNEQKEISSTTSTTGEESNVTATTGIDKAATNASSTSAAVDSEGEQQPTNKITSSQVSNANSNGSQWWVKERVSGSFSRSFTFPAPINTDNVKASFANGVLKVIIPKESQGRTKQINIE